MSTDPTKSESEAPSRPVSDRNNRELIVDVAAQLFTKNGYEGTSIAAIAKEVGVTPPAVYWHFESKSDLLGEVLEAGQAEFTRTMNEVPTGSSPSEELQALAGAHVRYQLERALAARLYSQASYGMPQLVGALPPDRRIKLQESARRYVARVKSVIQRGMVNGVFHVADATPAAFAIIYMCENVTWWFNNEGSLSIDEVSQMYAEFAIRLVTSRAIS